MASSASPEGTPGRSALKSCGIGSCTSDRGSRGRRCRQRTRGGYSVRAPSHSLPARHDDARNAGGGRRSGFRGAGRSGIGRRLSGGREQASQPSCPPTCHGTTSPAAGLGRSTALEQGVLPKPGRKLRSPKVGLQLLGELRRPVGQHRDQRGAAGAQVGCSGTMLGLRGPSSVQGAGTSWKTVGAQDAGSLRGAGIRGQGRRVLDPERVEGCSGLSCLGEARLPVLLGP